MTNYQSLDLENLDLSTDKSFVDNLKRLDEISRMTDGMRWILGRFSDDLGQLDPEQLIF